MKKITFIILLLNCFYLLSQDTNSLKIKPPLEPHGVYIAPKNFEEKTANFFMSPRFKIATAQRDSLYKLTQKLTTDTATLGNLERQLNLQISQLQAELAACKKSVAEGAEMSYKLSNQYSNLEKRSSEELTKLKNELDEKAVQQELLEQELRTRERRVAELESILKKQDSTVRAINKAIKDALLQFNSPELSVQMRNGKVYVSMSDKILFKSGKSEVQEEGIAAIAKVADILNEIKDVGIMIEGHTDNVPIKTPQYRDNWDLSVARATAITRLLIEMGIIPNRITASGRAEFAPKASNMDREGRAKNRRTEIVLIPNLDEIYKLVSSSVSP